MANETQAMELKPCPFCGAGDTLSEVDSSMWTGMRTVILSWHVRHWCGPKDAKFGNILRCRAKTQEEAEIAWNTRFTLTPDTGAKP
jgi:hypothetical protein